MNQANQPTAVFASTAELRAATVDGGRRHGADSGDPRTRYAELFALDGVETGLWACSPGGWEIRERADTEVVMILSGAAHITDSNGQSKPVGPGDVFVLPKGWSGRWDIFETVEKLYVTIAEEQS